MSHDPNAPESDKEYEWHFDNAVAKDKTDFERFIALLEIEDENRDIVDLCSEIMRSARGVLEALPRRSELILDRQATLSSDYVDFMKAFGPTCRALSASSNTSPCYNRLTGLSANSKGHYSIPNTAWC